MVVNLPSGTVDILTISVLIATSSHLRLRSLHSSLLGSSSCGSEAKLDITSGSVVVTTQHVGIVIVQLTADILKVECRCTMMTQVRELGLGVHLQDGISHPRILDTLNTIEVEIRNEYH